MKAKGKDGREETAKERRVGGRERKAESEERGRGGVRLKRKRGVEGREGREGRRSGGRGRNAGV